MKKEDIKELTTEELKARLVEEKSLYAKMKINHAISSIENPMKIRSIRRGIAQIHSELGKRAKQVAAK
jgi:large subunit ribosomal protein L29